MERGNTPVFVDADGEDARDLINLSRVTGLHGNWDVYTFFAMEHQIDLFQWGGTSDNATAGWLALYLTERLNTLGTSIPELLPAARAARVREWMSQPRRDFRDAEPLTAGSVQAASGRLGLGPVQHDV